MPNRRPVILLIALALLSFEMVGNYLFTIAANLYLAQTSLGPLNWALLAGASLLVVVESTLLCFVFRGRTWARILLAFLVLIVLAGYLVGLEEGIGNGLQVYRDLSSLALQIAGAVLLFVPSTSSWFRRHASA